MEWLWIIAGLLALLQIAYYRRVAFKKLSYSRSITRSRVYDAAVRLPADYFTAPDAKG